MKFLLILFIIGLVLAGIVAIIVYWAFMAMLFVAGVIWFLWAALLAVILSAMLDNGYDAIVFGAILAIPAAIVTFSLFGKKMVPDKNEAVNKG